MKRISLSVAVLILLTSCGCVTYKQLTPIRPKPLGGIDLPFLNPTRVDSLQPTFEWVARSEPSVTYDFAIYDCIRGKVVLLTQQPHVVGMQCYYREGLPSATHTLEVPLQPDRLYYWSVRVRSQGKPGPWARFDWNALGGWGGYTKATNCYFLIRTPKH
jgi:hypothetical protein